MLSLLRSAVGLITKMVSSRILEVGRGTRPTVARTGPTRVRQRSKSGSDTSNRFGLVTPVLAPLLALNSEQRDDRVYPANEPIRTLTAAGCRTYQLLTPFLAPLTHAHDGRGRESTAVYDITDPLRTITCASRGEFALIAPTLINTRNGERKGQDPRVMDIRAPFNTITAAGSQGALVAAFLAKHNAGHEATGQKLHAPIDTVTTKDSKALVTSHLVKLRGGVDSHPQTAQDVREPAPTLTAGGTHVAEVRITLVPRDSIDEAYVERAVQTCAFLVKYFGTGVARPLEQPLGTLTTKDRVGLVTVMLVRVGDREWVLADIGMRMLTPRELFLCQGFPASYEIEHVDLPTALGFKVRTKLTKKAQTRLVGNSVPPWMVSALVAANLQRPEAMAA